MAELRIRHRLLQICERVQTEARLLSGATAHQSRSAVLDQLARDAYRPYAPFWKGTWADEARFSEWARPHSLRVTIQSTGTSRHPQPAPGQHLHRECELLVQGQRGAGPAGSGTSCWSGWTAWSFSDGTMLIWISPRSARPGGDRVDARARAHTHGHGASTVNRPRQRHGTAAHDQ